MEYWLLDHFVMYRNIADEAKQRGNSFYKKKEFLKVCDIFAYI